MSTVEIEVQELVLDGAFGARSGAIREALAEELQRLASEGGLTRPKTLARATVSVSAELSPRAIAAAIARAVYDQLTGGEP